MNESSSEIVSYRRAAAILRMTVGLIVLATWYDNLQKGVYTTGGIEGLFAYIFNDAGGGPAWYRSIIQATVLQAPGAFASFQLVAELLLGLGLLFGGLTVLAGAGATLFFFNLLLAYFGGSEWIWTYVLLTVSALSVTWMRAGRLWGLDAWLLKTRGEAPNKFLW